MDNLVRITRDEVHKYAANGEGVCLRLYPILDDVSQIYTVNAVHLVPNQERSTGIVVMARIEGDYVVIEEERTDKPLLDALLQQGIPREQIILAYAGETLPEQVNAPGD
jgi:hypothetical protein